MSDEELADKIDAILEAYYRGQLSPYEALNQISRAKGEHDTRRPR
jgi:hypothetical protein